MITEIIKDKRYYSICKGIAKNHLADDLYQEFILALCEIKDDRLTKAREGGYLEVFCVGVINNIWNNRKRIKSYVNGSTSNLFEYTSSGLDETITYKYIVEEEKYDINKDIKYSKTLKIIDSDKSSGDLNLWYDSQVFYHSTFTHKNPRQLSQKSGIAYLNVLNAYKRYKERLKKLLK